MKKTQRGYLQGLDALFNLLLICAIGGVIAAVVGGIGWFSSVSDEDVAELCREQGYFVVNHHKYTCQPSGEWVTE